ncbi:hypothetical protein GEMRC1_007106 [Eukaryota sp. GEM-RC1]
MWDNPSCWTNGVPTDNSDIYLDNCDVYDQVILPRILVPDIVDHVILGSSNCSFNLILAPGAFLSANSWNFVSGEVSGLGFIQVYNSIVLSSPQPKVIRVQVNNRGNMSLTDGPIHVYFQSSGILMNSGNFTVETHSVLTYTSDWHSSDNEQPRFINQRNLILPSSNSSLQIDVPFSNYQSVSISNGSLILNSPDELMGRYHINGSIVLNSYTFFARGSDVFGTGDISVSSGVTALVGGAYRLIGSANISENALLHFLDRSIVNFFYTTSASDSSRVIWDSGCRLRLYGFIVNVAHGTFTVKSGASWTPTGQQWDVQILLSGNAKFTFEQSVGRVEMSHLKVVNRAELVINSGIPVEIDRVDFGNGDTCHIFPRITGQDTVYVRRSMHWYNGLLQNNLQISANNFNDHPPAQLHVYHTSEKYRPRHTGSPNERQCSAILDQHKTLTVSGHIYISGVLNTRSNIIIQLYAELSALDAVYFLIPHLRVDFMDTSESYVTSHSSFSDGNIHLISAHHYATISFGGNLTLIDSQLTLLPKIVGDYVQNSNYTLKKTSNFLIQTTLHSFVNGTFDVSNTSTVSTINNEITFVPLSVFKGDGLLNPGHNGRINFKGILQVLFFFSDAFIDNLLSVEAVSGTFSILNCKFGLSSLVLDYVTFSSVDGVFSGFTPPLHIKELSNIGRTLLLNSTGPTLTIDKAIIRGSVNVLNIVGSIEIVEFYGISGIFRILNHNNQIIIPLISLSSSARLQIFDCPSSLRFPSITSTGSSRLEFANVFSLDLVDVSFDDNTRFDVKNTSTLSVNQFLINGTSTTTIDEISNLLGITNLIVAGQSKCSLTDLSKFTLDNLIVEGVFTLNLLHSSLTIPYIHSIGEVNMISINGSFSSSYAMLNDSFFDFISGDFSVSELISTGPLVVHSVGNDFSSLSLTTLNTTTISVVQGEMSINFYNNTGVALFEDVSNKVTITDMYTSLNFSAIMFSELSIGSLTTNGLLSLNTIPTLSVSTFVQSFTCYSQSTFSNVDSFSSTKFTVHKGKVTFSSVLVSSFSELDLLSIDDASPCSVEVHNIELDSLSVTSSVSIDSRSTWSLRNIKQSLSIPEVDITGKLYITNTDFDFSLSSVILSDGAVLSLNSGHTVTILNFLHMFDTSVRTGTDSLVVVQDSRFVGGSFSEGKTHFSANFEISSNFTKLFTNSATVTVSATSQILSSTNELLFGGGAVLELLSTSHLEIFGSITFVQRPTSSTSKVISLDGSDVILHDLSSFEVFWEGSLSLQSLADTTIFKGGAAFDKALFDLNNQILMFDGRCFDSHGITNCTDFVLFTFESDSVLSTLSASLVTTDTSKVVYSGAYNINPSYLHHGGFIHFLDSTELEVDSINSTGGEVFVQNSYSIHQNNEWKFLYGSDSTIQLVDLSSTNISTISLSSTELFVTNVISFDSLFFVPSVSLASSSLLNVLNSHTVIPELNVDSGSLVIQNMDMIITSAVLFDEASVSTINCDFIVDEEASLSFVGSGTKELQADSVIELHGTFILDSSSPFTGYSGARFIVMEQSRIIFKQSSLWTVATGVTSMPSLEIFAPNATTIVNSNFEISWKILTNSHWIVTNSSSFICRGSGRFDSVLSLCSNCSLTLSFGEYIFPESAVLEGIDGNIDAKLFIYDGSSVLFNGLFLMNPAIVLGSGHLHFQNEAVFNISSLIITGGGSIKFSTCPDSGSFELSHLIVEGTVVFDTVISCTLSIGTAEISNGSLTIGTIHAVDIDSLQLNSGSIAVDHIDGDLTIRDMSVFHGSIDIKSISGDLSSTFISIEDGSATFSNILGDVHSPTVSVTGGFINFINVTKTIQSPLFDIQNGYVLLQTIGDDVNIDILSLAGGSLNFEELSGDLNILGMNLMGGELSFESLFTPLFLNFMTVNGSTVKFNSNFDATINNFTVLGSSLITGKDHVYVTDNFLWFGGNFYNLHMSATQTSSTKVSSHTVKTLSLGSITIESTAILSDSSISFGQQSLLSFTSTSDVYLYDAINLLYNPSLQTLLQSLSSTDHDAVVAFDTTVTFSSCILVIDVFLDWSGSGTVDNSSISLMRGCHFKGSMDFISLSYFNILDKAEYEFTTDASLNGNAYFTSSFSDSHNSQLKPVTHFHGLFDINTFVYIDYGDVYFEPDADFTITLLTILHPGKCVFTQSKGTLWQMDELIVSGTLEIVNVERDLSFFNFSVHGSSSFVSFDSFNAAVVFNNPVYVSQGRFEMNVVSNVFFPELDLSNSATFISEEIDNFEFFTLRSQSSTTSFRSNPNSHDLLVSNFTFDSSNINGPDNLHVNWFVFNSGTLNIVLFSQYSFLHTTGTKVLSSNAKLSFIVYSEWTEGTIQGQTNAELVIEQTALFESYGTSLHFPGSSSTTSFRNGPRLIVEGTYQKYAITLLTTTFEFFIKPTGQFFHNSGSLYIRAGGYNRGLFETSNSTSTVLGASRNKFAEYVGAGPLELRPGSVNRIHGSFSVEKFAMLYVFSAVELFSTDFDAGFIYFSPQSHLIQVGRHDWKCTRHCTTVFNDYRHSVSFDRFNLIDGGHATFHNFDSSYSISLNQSTIQNAHISCLSSTSISFDSLLLSSAIIQGTDTVAINNDFEWTNGRLGSLDHLGHTLTLELLGSSKLTSDLNKNVLFRSVINNRGSFYIVDHFLFWFYRQTVLNNFGYFQHGAQCGSNVCNSLSNFVYQTLDHSSSATYNNHGSFVKHEGTLILTNQLLFNQFITGYFESQNSRFIQQVVASVRGEVQLNPGTYFDVGSTTLNAWENSVWNGLGGTLRAISWGSRIFFYGRYNLTLDLIHNMGEFVFKRSADIELDTITLNNGTLVFEEGKERKAIFDLKNVRVVDGFLHISHVPQFFIIDNIYQSLGKVLIDNVSNYFTIDSFKVTAGDFTIDTVTQNMTFVKKMELDGGNVYLKNLLQWLIFQDGLLVRNPHRLRIEDVGLSLWSLGDVDISGGFNVLNIGLDFVIDQDLFFRQNCTTVVNTIDNSLVVLGTITQLQAFSSQTTTFQNVKNSFILHKDLDMQTGSLTFRDITSKVSVSQRIVQTGGSLLFDVVGDIYNVTEGIRLTGGSATFRSLSEDLSTQFIEVLNPADAKFLSVNTLSVVEKIEVTGTLTIVDYTHGNVPLFLVNHPSRTEIKKGITFNITNNLRGTGGFANFRDLVVFETASFEPHGANFLFEDLHTNYLVPSFDIRSGSIVDLHRFHYAPPQLHDIGIYSGTLTLRTDQVVNTDYLVLDHSNARRNGKDLTLVRDGVDFIAGTFGTLGITNALTYLNLSSSARKTINAAEVISSDYAVIQVDNGEVVGINAGILRLQTVSQVFGDFHFLTTETSGIRLPQFINEDFMMFASALERRLMDWRIKLPPNTVNNVNDFELALGRGGGLIETNITLCSDCLLAFDSNMPFNSRTKHIFTDVSAISCPTCRIEFRSDQSWVDFSGIFDLLSYHVQTFGRLDFQSPARVPITHLELSNSRVSFFSPTMYYHVPGVDPFVMESIKLMRCGRLHMDQFVYELNVTDIVIDGGLLNLSTMIMLSMFQSL